MNLWILHNSFINHQFYHSTITIKQKIIINKLVTELLWGHFLWKNSCSNEKCQIPRQKDEFRGNSAAQIPRQKPKITRNSAGRGKLWALVMTLPVWKRPITLWCWSHYDDKETQNSINPLMTCCIGMPCIVVFNV